MLIDLTVVLAGVLLPPVPMPEMTPLEPPPVPIPLVAPAVPGPVPMPELERPAAGRPTGSAGADPHLPIFR
ncbi:hypothetical protein JCM10369A_41980 [Nocardioides pyridinolyticus]